MSSSAAITAVQRMIKMGTLLIACALTACSTPTDHAQLEGQPPTTPGRVQLPPLDPQLLLNRVSWGINASSNQQLQTLGVNQYLQQQLQPNGAPLPAQVQAHIDALDISQRPFVQIMHELEAQREQAQQQKGIDDTLRKAYQQALTRQAREAASRIILRSLYSPHQLLEQMNWFWLNHFSISIQKANLRAMLGDYDEQAIHPYALGSFRDMLRASLMHPAMLRYLDNEHNSVGHINENYARELLELHTMGVDGGYTQHDVQELARVLTGVGLNLNDRPVRLKPQRQALYIKKGLFEFNPNRHDFGDKQLLGHTIHGSGFDEVEQVLTLLTQQPATARFISRKIALYLVSASPSEALIERMAQEFLHTNGDIARVLRVMFMSPEFAASLGQQFKDPIHYVMASMRLAYGDTVILNTTPVLNWLKQMGQAPGGRATPDGYALQESAWASSGQLSTRFEIAKIIASDQPNLFRKEGDDTAQKPGAIPHPMLATSGFVKTWATRYSSDTQQALNQANSPQEWNALFLSAPETMRR